MLQSGQAGIGYGNGRSWNGPGGRDGRQPDATQDSSSNAPRPIDPRRDGWSQTQAQAERTDPKTLPSPLPRGDPERPATTTPPRAGGSGWDQPPSQGEHAVSKAPPTYGSERQTTYPSARQGSAQHSGSHPGSHPEQQGPGQYASQQAAGQQASGQQAWQASKAPLGYEPERRTTYPSAGQGSAQHSGSYPGSHPEQQGPGQYPSQQAAGQQAWQASNAPPGYEPERRTTYPSAGQGTVQHSGTHLEQQRSEQYPSQQSAGQQAWQGGQKVWAPPKQEPSWGTLGLATDASPGWQSEHLSKVRTGFES